MMKLKMCVLLAMCLLVSAVARAADEPLVLKKGTLIGPAEVAALEAAEIKQIVVARLEPGDASEDAAAAAIATRMAEKQISLESIVQRGRLKRGAAAGGPVPVILLTYATTEALIREALAKVVEDGYIAERPQLIRIERD